MTQITSLVQYDRPLEALLGELLRARADVSPLVVGAEPLTVAEVFRVAHAGSGGMFASRPVALTDDATVLERNRSAIARLRQWLNEKHVIYGVNTGYGGTGIFNRQLDDEGLAQLQSVLIDGLLCSGKQDELPSPWVRGTMLVRVVSNLAGVSGLRTEVMQAIVQLLNEDIVPVLPAKGSLTASGDLVPLAYLVAVLQQHEDPRVEVHCRGRRMPARAALEPLGIAPLRLEPKEALALVNGTSVAAAAGCDVSVQALNSYYLTVALTAFSTAVVRGTLQPYHPFVSEVKPHAGQVYASRMIFNLLHAVDDELLPKTDLVGFAPALEHRVWQLPYPFRCAAQHLAPDFDTLLRSWHDLSIEINSVSDNPLILDDSERGVALSAGNFLGSTVARDMDQMKLMLHSLARLVHSQLKYLVRGVEPILSRTEERTLQERFLATHLIPLSSHPADNMGFQGVEIYADALLSDMNQRVMPHSTTYLAAEKENQAVVSMALAAARTARDIAADVHYCLAAHLLACCQAFDLTTLPVNVVRRQEALRENATIENPRVAQLGYLRPLYDFVRQECGVPTFFGATRLHTHLQPLIQRIESLDLLAYLHERTIVPALTVAAYDDYGTSRRGGD